MESPQVVTAVVDGNNLLHRILHVPALAKLRMQSGQMTGGIFGFLTSLRMALDKLRVGSCVVVWDAGHSPRRLAVLPSYKQRDHGATEKEIAKHAEHDALFKGQKTSLEEMLSKMGVRQASVPGREADDVFHAIVTRNKAPYVVVSDDKDCLQLVSDTVSVFRPTKDRHVTVQSFREDVGVARGLFLIRLALLGDDSDNIPAIPGVGETTVTSVMRVASVYLRAQGVDVDVAPGKIPDALVFDAIKEAVAELAATDRRGARRYFALQEGAAQCIARNLELMDLSREVFDSDPTPLVFSTSPTFDEMWVNQAVAFLEFADAIKDFPAWSGPYRRLR